MAALDDLVEMDLASAQEEWQDFEEGTANSTAQVADSSPSTQAGEIAKDNTANAGTNAQIQPLSTPNPISGDDDIWAVAEADQVDTAKQAPATQLKAPQELDLLDFDTPVVEQPIQFASTPSIPLQLAVQPLAQPHDELADDASNDEWTDFEEVAPPAQDSSGAKEQITASELQLIAEQLFELKQYDCAYQCLHFCEVRAMLLDGTFLNPDLTCSGFVECGSATQPPQYKRFACARLRTATQALADDAAKQ